MIEDRKGDGQGSMAMAVRGKGEVECRAGHDHQSEIEKKMVELGGDGCSSRRQRRRSGGCGLEIKKKAIEAAGE